MRARAWQPALSALLAPLLLLTHAASAYSLFRCQYNDVVRRDCCCPQVRPVGHERPPALVAACCCDVAHHESPRIPSEPVRKASGGDAPAVALVSPVLEAPVAVAGPSARARDTEPIESGPPLFTLTRSLLI